MWDCDDRPRQAAGENGPLSTNISRRLSAASGLSSTIRICPEGGRGRKDARQGRTRAPWDARGGLRGTRALLLAGRQPVPGALPLLPAAQRGIPLVARAVGE